VFPVSAFNLFIKIYTAKCGWVLEL
jgi:hypothetical protein